MIKNGMILAVALTALGAHGETVKTATQPWVRNYVATNTTSLAAATNYTNRALADFAATGTVWRSLSYGTETRWTDATGCVWSVTGAYADWHISTNGIPFKTIIWDDMAWVDGDTSMSYTGESWFFTGPWIDGAYDGPEDILSFAVEAYIYSYGDFVEAEVEFARDAVYVYQTNLVGRVALTNDVTAEIRKQSLGGIWDSKLEVWWTPIMENGALRYCATTNVNMEANQ